MPPKKRFLTCEICENRASRTNLSKRKFMAKFPLDKARCRQWVKVVGKEDLIYVPIEKLHTLKYVCGNHFENSAFNKKQNRLKQSAVPSKNLSAAPLPDEMLVEFPLHIHSNIDVTTDCGSKRICDSDASVSHAALPGPSSSSEKASHSVKAREEEALSGKAGEETSFSGEAVEHSSSSWQDSAVALNEIEDDPKPEFSWQQESAVVPCDDDHPERLPPPAPCLESPPHAAECEKPALDLTNYKCNFCTNTITGFRYTCVQCADVDLCGACEARQAHHAHYVLRIPQNRPLAEVVARLRAIRRALLANAIDVTGGALEDKVEVKDEPSQDHADVVLCQGDDTDVEMYQEDPIDIICPDQAELVVGGIAEKDPIDVNPHFDLSPSLGREDLVKNGFLDCASDDGASDLDCSHEETFSELSKQTDTQLKPVTITRHKPTSSPIKPLRTSPAKTQAESVVKSLPVFCVKSLSKIPTNPQQLFTIQTTQSKSSTDKTVLRLTPASCPAVDPNRSIVTLDRIKPIIRNVNAKEEPVSERLKPTFPVSRQTEIIQRNLITQRLGLGPISTTKRNPEKSLPSCEAKKIKTHHETKSSSTSLQHMNAAVVRLQRLPPPPRRRRAAAAPPPRCDATDH